MAKRTRKKVVEVPTHATSPHMPRSVVTAAEYRSLVTQGPTDAERAEVRRHLEGLARLA